MSNRPAGADGRHAAAAANLRASLASEAESTGAGEQADAAQECMPCGGRGELISKLGGQERVVKCPWCEGSGRRRKGIDAQAGWLEQRDEDKGDDPVS